MFGIAPGEQWDVLADYELLHRPWREEVLTWSGRFRPPLQEVTSLPPPHAGAPRVWHGSATTETSFSLPTMRPHEQQLKMLERLVAEVLPVVRKAVPTTLWTDADPYGGRPAAHGRSVADAAAGIEKSRSAGPPDTPPCQPSAAQP